MDNENCKNFFRTSSRRCNHLGHLTSFYRFHLFYENKVMKFDFIKKVLNVRLKIEEHKLNVQFCYVM